MAKSIFEILTDGKTETSVPEVKDKDGKIVRKNYGMVEHNMPLDKLPTPEEFADETMLLEWARESGQLHACLQSGVQKRLIDYRAIFKAMPGKETNKIWSPEYGQEQVDKAEWKIVEKPKGNGSARVADARYADCMAMLSNLLMAGIAKDQAIEAITNTYGEELVQTVLNGLNKKANE